MNNTEYKNTDDCDTEVPEGVRYEKQYRKYEARDTKLKNRRDDGWED
jgi:hypothetical protein